MIVASLAIIAFVLGTAALWGFQSHRETQQKMLDGRVTSVRKQLADFEHGLAALNLQLDAMDTSDAMATHISPEALQRIHVYLDYMRPEDAEHALTTLVDAIKELSASNFPPPRKWIYPPEKGK